jgi:hypothetical protein
MFRIFVCLHGDDRPHAVAAARRYISLRPCSTGLQEPTPKQPQPDAAVGLQCDMPCDLLPLGLENRNSHTGSCEKVEQTLIRMMCLVAEQTIDAKRRRRVRGGTADGQNSTARR